MHFQLEPTVLPEASLAKRLADGTQLTASSGRTPGRRGEMKGCPCSFASCLVRSSSWPSTQGARDQRVRARTKRGCDSCISWSGESKDGEEGWWLEMDHFLCSEEADRGHLCCIKSPGPGQRLCKEETTLLQAGGVYLQISYCMSVYSRSHRTSSLTAAHTQFTHAMHTYQ